MLLLVLSLLVAVAVSWRLARVVAGGAQQFWLGLAALVLPWGLIANLLSVVHGLTPMGWLVMQGLLAGGVFWAARRWPAHPVAVPRGWSALELALGVGVAGVLGLLLAMQWAEPIWIGDDIRYHASRVLYWIGNQSVFPFATHNDRQTYFAYQGELAFLWPVLFTRIELIGRMVFWLATPLTSVALYLVARRLGAGRAAALAATLWFLVTPIVLRHGYGLKPEIWLTLYFLGAIWWLLEGLETNRGTDFVMAGVFCALAVSTKLNLLAVVPVLLAVPWFVRGVTNPARSMRGLVAGLVSASLLSGIALLLVFNIVRGGHPLGPAGMREVHSAEISARQVRTHLARLPWLLFELPVVTSPGLQASLEGAGKGVLHALDADQPLPLERADGWPGLFTFTVPQAARNYSLGGMALLLLLMYGAVRVVREGRRQSPASAAWLLMAALLFAVLLAVRWMVHSGLPERFLIPSFAVAMALIPVLLPERWRMAVLGLCLVLTGMAPVAGLAMETARVWKTPPTPEEILGQFTEAMDRIPPGAHILFFGNQDAPDYPLFSAPTGYDRRMTPWGKGPFDAAALEKLVQEKQITHILCQDGRAAYFHWDPPLTLGPFVDWATRRAGSRMVQLETPLMVLVSLASGAALPDRPSAPRQLLTEAPADRPLVMVDRELRGQVGIDGGRMGSPWPIENLGPEEKGYLWLGSGPDEGLRFRLWAEEATAASITLHAGAGPSRTDSERTVVLRAGSAEQRQTFKASGEVRFEAALTKGANAFVLYAADAPTVAAQANGDTRRLIVGLRDVAIGTASKVSGALVRGKGVAIESGSLKSPWIIENLGPPENEFLWLGSGEEQGLGFAMTAEKAGVVVLRMQISPGPSRTDAARRVALLMDGKPAGEQVSKEAGVVEFRVTAAAGRHEVRFYAKDPPTVLKLANGDPRHLIAGLHEITVEAGAKK